MPRAQKALLGLCQVARSYERHQVAVVVEPKPGLCDEALDVEEVRLRLDQHRVDIVVQAPLERVAPLLTYRPPHKRALAPLVVPFGAVRVRELLEAVRARQRRNELVDAKLVRAGAAPLDKQRLCQARFHLKHVVQEGGVDVAHAQALQERLTLSRHRGALPKDR